MDFYCVLEGVDGSGKTVTARAAAEILSTVYGIGVQRTREPGGTVFGEAQREFILHDPRAAVLPQPVLAMLFAAVSYHNAVEDRGDARLLLSDRWAPISSRVFQLRASTAEEAPIVTKFWDNYVQLLKDGGTPRRPDLIVYLRTSTDTAWSRRNIRKTENDNTDQGRYEHSAARGVLYDALFATPPYGIHTVTIDTDFLPPEEVASQVVDAILTHSKLNAIDL